MSQPHATSGGESWQYQSRSDRHSKVACWTLLLDLLNECKPFRDQAKLGLIGFRVNCVVVGPINKTLDLVVSTLSAPRAKQGRRTFAEVGQAYEVRLTPTEKRVLSTLPVLYEDMDDDVSEVAIALEAKACMTEHSKSLPRLHAEIVATGYLAKRAKPNCITVSYSLVNAADWFRSPGARKSKNDHSQPADARKVIDMISKAIPRTSDGTTFGYDVVGITSIVCRNDGSQVELATGAAAPSSREAVNYSHMVLDLCSSFRRRFTSR